MDEPIEQHPEDDWVDQDLLTRDLAGDLLDREIAAEQARLAEPEVPDSLLSRADRERRLAAMIAVRDRHRTPNVL
ncbi:hypothetical protein [Rhodococcus gannanensis]|uniref:Uncharacterized protein n=1 Tax=Rhodococcus gannanensis TaxID=1960308 RepID=A0ABW4P2C1_9NOCA